MSNEAVLSEDALDEISRRARIIYSERLQAMLEPTANGQFVAIHVDSADYSVGRTSSGARFALRKHHPAGMIVTTKIGPAADDSLTYRMLASQFMAGQQK